MGWSSGVTSLEWRFMYLGSANGEGPSGDLAECGLVAD